MNIPAYAYLFFAGPGLGAVVGACGLIWLMCHALRHGAQAIAKWRRRRRFERSWDRMTRIPRSDERHWVALKDTRYRQGSPPSRRSADGRFAIGR